MPVARSTFWSSRKRFLAARSMYLLPGLSRSPRFNLYRYSPSFMSLYSLNLAESPPARCWYPAFISPEYVVSSADQAKTGKKAAMMVETIFLRIFGYLVNLAPDG